MAKTKPMRVPAEFVAWVDTLSYDFAQQTGYPKNNSATMRRMATEFRGKIIVKGTGFDFAIFGRTRKKR
jgi:hypothetical protein